MTDSEEREIATMWAQRIMSMFALFNVPPHIGGDACQLVLLASTANAVGGDEAKAREGIAHLKDDLDANIGDMCRVARERGTTMQ